MALKKEIILLAILVTTVGCKTRYITQTHTQIEYREKYTRDSVYMQDSIYITRLNDTVYISRYKYFYKNLLKRDTVSKTDTIGIPVETIKLRQVNYLTPWQSTRLKIFDFLAAALIGAILYILRKPFIKLIRNII